MILHVHTNVEKLEKIQAESFQGFLNVICFNLSNFAQSCPYCDISANSILTSQPMQNLPEIVWSTPFNVTYSTSVKASCITWRNEDQWWSLHVGAVSSTQGFKLINGWITNLNACLVWQSRGSFFLWDPVQNVLPAFNLEPVSHLLKNVNDALKY